MRNKVDHYQVIAKFNERYDKDPKVPAGHEYLPGKAYPRKGYTPPAGRADALCEAKVGPMNATGKVYLKPAEPGGSTEECPLEEV